MSLALPCFKVLLAGTNLYLGSSVESPATTSRSFPTRPPTLRPSELCLHLSARCIYGSRGGIGFVFFALCFHVIQEKHLGEAFG